MPVTTQRLCQVDDIAPGTAKRFDIGKARILSLIHI